MANLKCILCEREGTYYNAGGYKRLQCCWCDIWLASRECVEALQPHIPEPKPGEVWEVMAKGRGAPKHPVYCKYLDTMEWEGQGKFSKITPVRKIGDAK